MTRFEAVLNAQTLLTQAVTRFPGMAVEVIAGRTRVTFSMLVEKGVSLGTPWVESMMSSCSQIDGTELMVLEGMERDAIEFQWCATDN